MSGLTSGVVERKGKNTALTYRVLSSVFLIPIVAVFVYLGGWWMFALGLGITLIAIREFCAIIERAGYKPLTIMTALLAVAFITDAQLMVEGISLPGGASLARFALAAAVVVSLVSQVLREDDHHKALTGWAFLFAGATYIGWLLRYYLLLRNLESDRQGMLVAVPGISLELERGALWLALVIAGTWLCDTCAYFVGSAYGRHKLIPRVSPGKTWEGTVAGVVAATLSGMLATPLLGLHPVAAFGLGLTIGVAAVFGDLAESLIKRGAHVKDASTLIPGHGGLLDRLDSMLFTGVAAYYYVILTQVGYIIR